MIRSIAAVDVKLGVANDSGIPWQGLLPKEVEYFRKKTEGEIILMGYGFYAELKKPFPDRLNLVASSKSFIPHAGFTLVPDARKFLNETKKDIWLVGGANLYKTTLDLADEIYITRIDKDFHCTKFFPEFEHEFKLYSRSIPQTENNISYVFEVWRKLKL